MLSIIYLTVGMILSSIHLIRMCYYEDEYTLESRGFFEFFFINFVVLLLLFACWPVILLILLLLIIKELFFDIDYILVVKNEKDEI